MLCMKTVNVPSTFVVISDLVIIEFGPGCSLPVVCGYGHSHFPSVIVKEELHWFTGEENQGPITGHIALLKDPCL